MSDVLNPYAPPQNDAVSGPAGSYAARGRAYVQGGCLIVEKEASLPDVCLKCGTTSSLTRRSQKFQYTPPWVIFLFLVCTLGGIIAFLMTIKRATLLLPLCGECDRRWTSAKWAVGLGIVGLVLSVFLVIPLASISKDAVAFVPVLLILAVVGFVVLMVAYVKPRMLQVKKIDDTTITLAGVPENAANAIAAASGR
jgi:hypothetical protein